MALTAIERQRRYRAKPGVMERQRAYSRAWNKAHPGRRKELKRQHYLRNQEAYCLRAKRHKLKSKYGLTLEQYDKLIADARGRCQICKRPFSVKGPVIDHCHNTNVVRGVICTSCNAAEGHLASPEAALALYHYMLRNELFYGGKN